MICRQLDPQLHIESEHGIAEELSRFISRVMCINVGHAWTDKGKEHASGSESGRVLHIRDLDRYVNSL